MHKNTDFHIEQTRLNDTYRKLNSGNDFSSYINEQEKVDIKMRKCYFKYRC